jgi:ketosteroid isomerase-like protein
MSVMNQMVRVGMALVVSMACGGAVVSAQAGPGDMVRGRNSAIAQSVTAKDAAKIASFYFVDAEITQPGDRTRTREGIQRMWQEQLDRGLTAVAFTTQDADLANGVVTEKGSFVFQGKGGAVLSKGTYTNTWARDAGQWRIKMTAVVPAK